MSNKLMALIIACSVTLTALPLFVQADNNIEYAVETAKDSIQSISTLSDSEDEIAEVYLMDEKTGTLSALFEGEGTAESPYLLSTTNHISMLAIMVNLGNETYSSAHYKLTNSIDFTGINFTPIGKAVIALNDKGAEYDKDKYPFKGHFNGNGYALENITINSSDSVIGVFGIGYNAKVENLRIENITINAESNGTMHIGGLFGRYEGSSDGEDLHITGCHVDGSIVSRGGFNVHVGGMVGKFDVRYGVSLVSNCRADVDIDAVATSYQYAGGLIGNVETGGDLSKCVVTGNIYGESTGGANSYVGGVTARLCFNYWMGISSLSDDNNASLMSQSRYSSAANLVSGNSIESKALIYTYISNTIAHCVKADVSISNCYYDLQHAVTPSINSYEKIFDVDNNGKNSSELFDKTFLKNTIGLDFENTWTMVLGKPELIEKDPYIAYEISGSDLTVQPVGCGNCNVIVAIYENERLVTTKIAEYTDGTPVPLSLNGLSYDNIKILAVNNSLSPLCEAVEIA